MANLTHINAAGEAHMVDVGAKPDQRRIAIASGRISMSREAFEAIRDGNLKKGDALGVARVAGIMAAKRTSDLIPLCHPISLTKVEVTCALDEEASAVDITSRAECVGKTGVEMEALTAVSVAALTVYDMAKAIDKHMVIGPVELVSKEKKEVTA
ncbi:MAG TPA: cyclic pyranopterin monophosphate synthase MoaC [Thermoflexales bacterium]|nr:cyclic pyranopterin monophosphate synthase MoaC [Thermoflexales bacterium]HQW35184.1 cyclic pyranopterin monophosphate synthase MoaC [Thermoflexales bacterium]HQZ98893.1 cyclic pyranopterin monophosphate synthase MoaC [Thermoflexales bacterium]